MAFLDKGVGVESSEKLMKELADPSSRLGIQHVRTKRTSRILCHHPIDLLCSFVDTNLSTIRILNEKCLVVGARARTQ